MSTHTAFGWGLGIFYLLIAEKVKWHSHDLIKFKIFLIELNFVAVMSDRKSFIML